MAEKKWDMWLFHPSSTYNDRRGAPCRHTNFQPFWGFCNYQTAQSCLVIQYIFSVLGGKDSWNTHWNLGCIIFLTSAKFKENKKTTKSRQIVKVAILAFFGRSSHIKVANWTWWLKVGGQVYSEYIPHLRIFFMLKSQMPTTHCLMLCKP